MKHLLLISILYLTAAQAVQFIVSNKCPFGLTLNGGAIQGALSPANVYLASGATYTYNNVPGYWISGRISAAPNNAYSTWGGLAEMTIANGNINYDISYVDGLVIPASVQGGSAGCQKVGCTAPYSAVNTQCPRGSDYSLLHPSGYGCVSSCSYCANGAHSSSSYCNRINGQIHACATAGSSANDGCGQALSDNTENVYCCSGYFDGQPGAGHTNGNKYCAALNRGMLSSPSNGNTNQWYQLTVSNQPAYNEYSKFVHNVCPGQYSFAYDDYNNAGNPDSGCNTDVLYVTWCPGDNGGGGNSQSMTTTTGTTGSNPTGPIKARINFQAPTATPPYGWITDIGNAYSSQNGLVYGWNTFDPNSRQRNSPVSNGNVLLDTLIHMQLYGTDFSWNLKVPAAYYDIVLVAGDPGYLDCHAVAVEGVLLLKGCTTDANHWIGYTGTVKVTDGKLSLTNVAGQSSNNKLAYISVFTSTGTVVSGYQTLMHSKRQIDQGSSNLQTLSSQEFITLLAEFSGESEDRFMLLDEQLDSNGQPTFHILIRDNLIVNESQELYPTLASDIALQLLQSEQFSLKLVSQSGPVPESYVREDSKTRSLFYVAIAAFVACMVFVAAVVIVAAIVVVRRIRPPVSVNSSQTVLPSPTDSDVEIATSSLPGSSLNSPAIGRHHSTSALLTPISPAAPRAN